jgi:hypothetical protein
MHMVGFIDLSEPDREEGPLGLAVVIGAASAADASL